MSSAAAAAEGELAVPLLSGQDDEETSGQEILTAEEPDADAGQQGDLEQGLNSAAGSEAGGSNKAEDEAAYEVRGAGRWDVGVNGFGCRSRAVS